MKLQNNINIDEFFKAVDSCEGKVELISDEGDCLNLKSKLSQYISLGKVLADGNMNGLKIIAYDSKDANILKKFVIDEG